MTRGPMVAGYLRPVILLPVSLIVSIPVSQLETILVHELAHVRRHDFIVNLLQVLIETLFFYHPAIWWLSRRIRIEREHCCDDLVVSLFGSGIEYGRALLAVEELRGRRAALALGATDGTLLARVRRIVGGTNHGGGGSVLWPVLGVAIVCTTLATLALRMGIEAADPPRTNRALVQHRDANRSSEAKPQKTAETPAAQVKADVSPNPTLHDLIQQMVVYEQAYLPFEIRSMETFRVGKELTPQERARYPWADGRKHQKLMEYAQLAERIWRKKETMLVDDEVEQGPYDSYSDGERIVQASYSPVVINGVKTREYYVNHRKNAIFSYLNATPLVGVFCFSTFGNGKLFSEAFKDDEEAVELTWDHGDAKLTFRYGKPTWNTRFALWLSRSHAWHPIRLQRYWDAKDKFWHDEWEVTKFVPQGKRWRVAEGTHRYRELKGSTVVDPKIVYAVDFKVLAEKFGSDVDERQFKFEIPAGAKVRDNQKPEAEPPPPTKTREITVTVIDVANQPVPNATVRIPASRLRDLDVVTTDEDGVARSAKAPEGNASVHITAPGFRPVTWIMGNVDKLRAIITPQTIGVTVDEQGNPVAGAWLPHRTPQLRADGFVWFPDRVFSGDREDWSGDDGRFTLKTDLTLRSLKRTAPLIAYDPDLKKIAIRIVPARELGQPQKLVLRPICKVHGHCLLEGMTEAVDIWPWLETSAGETVASVTTRHELTPDGLRIDFQLRLPPGDYVLKSERSSYHSGFSIPITVPRGRDDLDLGTKTVSATGAVALEGKPAPKLDVQWRPGQETNWEKLRGKVVVLDFWGTWCGPCVAGMPELMEIAKKFQDKPVAWLSIHTSNLKDFDEFDREVAKCEERDWNKKKLPFTAALDRPVAGSKYAGQTSERYGVAAWPTLIVVDRQGQVVGPIPKRKLAETIAGLLHDPAPPSAKADPAAAAAPTAKESKKLQGHWAVDSCRSEAETLRVSAYDSRRWRWTIKGDEISWGREGQEWKVKFQIDPAQTPPQIDLTFLNGPFKDEKCLGIYGWDGKEQKSLKILFRDPKAEAGRPVGFENQAGKKTTLITLHQIPPVDPKRELSSLQGTWCFDVLQMWDWPQPIGIGADSDGRRSEKRWVVMGNRITWVNQAGERIYVDFTIDPYKSPKQIDFKFLNGPYGGKKSIGIYEPQWGSDDYDKYLWFCMTLPGVDAPGRPTSPPPVSKSRR